MFIFKMMGSNLIASGKHKMFVGFFAFILILTVTLGATAIIAAGTLDTFVAYEYGSAACIYAAKQGMRAIVCIYLCWKGQFTKRFFCIWTNGGTKFAIRFATRRSYGLS